MKGRKKSLIRKPRYHLIFAIAALAGVFGMLLIISRALGIKVFSLPSRSMEPTYYAGTLICVKDADPNTLKPGDIITYMLEDNSVATHRIYKVIPRDSNALDVGFLTKGDSNDYPDPRPVNGTDIIGVPVFHVPLLGYVASYLYTAEGKLLAFIAMLLLLHILFAPDPSNMVENTH